MNSIVNYPALNGIIQIVASLYWAWHFVHLWYLYQYTDMLINLSYPNWLLALFVILSLRGVWGGLFVLLKKLKIKKGYAQLIGLLFFGLLIDLILMF